MENLDFTNIVQLMQPFIGKPISLVEGSRFDSVERILLSVDSDFKIRLLRAGVETLIDVTHKDIADVVQQFRFGGLSVKEIIDLGSEGDRFRTLGDALYCYKPDIHLVSSDDKKVPAHKVVLASRSPVFDAMFTVQMQEKDAPEVLLNKNSFQAVEAFVQLLYSQTPPKLKDHILEVIELADVYQIGRLDVLIGKHNLSKIFTCENAAAILFKAAERRQTEIWTAAFKFIADNPIDIESTESWKDMKHTGSTMDLDAQGLSEMLKLAKKPKV